MTRASVAAAAPQVKLLLCAARAEHTPADRVAMRALLDGLIDWTDLLSLAAQHRLLPLLVQHLRDHTDLVPADIWGELVQYERRNSLNSLRVTGELLQILAVFAAQDVAAVSYKGPFMAARLYGSIALRPVGDLDILVRKHDVPKARALLVDRGYEPVDRLTDANQAFRFAKRYAEDFRGRNGIHVDLHWRFTNSDIHFPLTLDDLIPRLETLQVAGSSAAVFGREDLLLILCAHGAKHRWDRLEWICALAEVMRTTPPMVWERIAERAAALEATRMLLLGTVLAHDLLDAPVPAALLLKARRHRLIRLLASDVQRRLLAWPRRTPRGVPAMLSRNLFQLGLQERARDWAIYLFYRLTTPNRPTNWNALAVGRFSLPVHTLTWPVGLGLKLVRRSLHWARSRRPKPPVPRDDSTG